MFVARFSYSQLPTEDQIIISRYTLTALLFVSALGAVRGSVPAISKIVVLGGIDQFYMQPPFRFLEVCCSFWSAASLAGPHP